MVDGSCNDNRDNTSQLHSPDDDDDVIIEHEHTGGTYKLRDSRCAPLLIKTIDSRKPLLGS